MPPPEGVRAIALLEAAKGALVILVGFGLFLLVHRDAQVFAEHLVKHLHLNPAHHYPQIFIATMANVSDARLQLLSAGAAGYAAVRFVEAYGLWRGRLWAQWFGAVGGAIYIPFDIFELVKHPRPLSVGALVVNVAVVAYLVRALRRRERKGE
jgi:uncharacterized membrane protein (DUF2068 family)